MDSLVLELFYRCPHCDEQDMTEFELEDNGVKGYGCYYGRVTQFTTDCQNCEKEITLGARVTVEVDVIEQREGE